MPALLQRMQVSSCRVIIDRIVLHLQLAQGLQITCMLLWKSRCFAQDKASGRLPDALLAASASCCKVSTLLHGISKTEVHVQRYPVIACCRLSSQSAGWPSTG